MPRDYKHRVNRRKKRSAVSPWLGVATGLLVGLFVAFLVYLKMRSHEPPPQVFVRETLPAQPAGEAETGTGKQKPAAPPEPRFDFYTLLPEMEVIVPEAEVRRAPQIKDPAVTAPAGTYYLQVGSFKNGEQADALKAKLALSGFEAVIHKATIEINQDKATYHRVRVGPFTTLDAANRTRKKLSASGTDSKVVEIKG